MLTKRKIHYLFDIYRNYIYEVYLEELSQSEVIQTIGTVEDDALFGNGFGQIFGRLCLACPGRPLWSSTKMKVKGTGEQHSG